MRINPYPKPTVHAKDGAFLAFLREQRCWCCRQRGLVQQYPTEAAHLESRRYGDAENAIPLCSWHHKDSPNAYHRLGKGWGQYWQTDPKGLALAYYQEFTQLAGFPACAW